MPSCYLAEDLIIHNYKISVIIPFDYKNYLNFIKHLDKNEKINIYRNFFTYKDKYSYIIFCNGHINITKIPDVKCIHNAINFLPNIIPQFKELITVNQLFNIDSMTATFNYNRIINLSNFEKMNYLTKIDQILLYEDEIYTMIYKPRKQKKIGIFYCPELFPGLKVVTDVGTAIIFASGKVNFVGLKFEETLFWIYKQIYILLKIYNKYFFEFHLMKNNNFENEKEIINAAANFYICEKHKKLTCNDFLHC